MRPKNVVLVIKGLRRDPDQGDSSAAQRLPRKLADPNSVKSSSDAVVAHL